MGLNQELQETLTLVLAGGKGRRLEPLTTGRAKPAVPFGAAYRIIDFTLSNCIHSGLRRIFVLTQYQAHSLEEHLRFAWNFLPRRLSQFIAALPPHHQLEDRWYRGTADAISHNLAVIASERPKHVVILSGDHIYKMDYGRMLREHIEREAAVTIGAVEIGQEDSSRFGILEVDSQDRIAAFQEKPQQGAEIPGKPGRCLGSMGIYIFETEELVRRLEDDRADTSSSHDFGNDVIPKMIGDASLYVHRFEDIDRRGDPYWRDVGTLESYFEANLDLISVNPSFNLYDQRWPTYTLWHNDPPAKTVFDSDAEGRSASVTDSLLSPGVIVSGAQLRRALLSNRVYVNEGSEVEDSIIFSGVRIGRNCKIRRAIIDKWVDIPDGTTIGYDREEDAARKLHVSETGITVLPNKFTF